MARIRTIKPAFFRHEALQDIEADNPGAYAMLVFAGLWGHCDKAGRFEWKPRTLKLDILPFLGFDMEATLTLLAAAKLVRRYEVGGRQYGVIDSFKDHQRIGGKEAQEPPQFPEPPGKQAGSDGEAAVKPAAPLSAAVNLADKRGDEDPASPSAEGSSGEATVKHLGLQEGKGRGREEEEEGKEEGKSSGATLPGEPESKPTREGMLCKRLREIGIDAAPHQLRHPGWVELLAAHSDEDIIGAAELVKKRKGKGERISINYLVPILTEPPKPPPTAGPRGNGRQARIDTYTAEAAAAQGEKHGTGSSGTDTGDATAIPGSARRIA